MSDSIGRRLKAARVKKGFSQAELAERIGVSQAAVGQWERGQYAPRGRNLNSLNEVLGPDLRLEEAQDWDPPPPVLSPSEFRAGKRVAAAKVEDKAEDKSEDISTQMRDHRLHSQEFQREVERVLIRENLNVRSGVRLNLPNSRRWIIELSTDHCVVEFTHPRNTLMADRDIERLLWHIAVLRAALGHDEKYVLLIREPHPSHVTRHPEGEDNFFDHHVPQIIEDASSVGIDVFVVRTPEQAAQILIDLEQEATEAN